VNEGWDDTVNTGISKIKTFLQTLAKDDNSAALVETVMRLLSKDRKGNLKASKVLELDKLGAKLGDADFLDGIKIIKDAYRPTPTCKFIDVSIRNEHGVWLSLPLSMSAIELPAKVTEDWIDSDNSIAEAKRDLRAIEQDFAPLSCGEGSGER
jgi:hypothetical protein